MKKILILGAGFGGLTVARTLDRMLGASDAQITIVNRDNFSLFTPMLPEVSAAGIAARHIAVPIRDGLRHARFHLGEVRGIDLDRRSVRIEHPLNATIETLEYDHLVIGLGGVTSTFNVPGVAERTLPLKTLEDADALRNRFVAMLELADAAHNELEDASSVCRRLLTFVVIGGGFTGVETAGEAADLFKSVKRFYPSISSDHIRIVLIEGGARLLPELPQKMGAYALRHLARRGVEVIVGDQVAAVDAESVLLKSGKKIESATVVWSAGVRPAPITAELAVEHGPRGSILTNPDFSVPGRPGVWALGDCAATPDPRAEYYPPTAQHALREGARLARNIVAVLRGAPTKPFVYTSLGSMASLGARRGIAALPGGFVLTGFSAWFLWRSYYLSRLPGWDRRLRVTFDWTMGVFFPRDIAELRVYSELSQREAMRAAGMGSIAP